MQNEYQWFLDNYSDLFRQYGTSFLAIKNKTVLGVYRSYAEGVRKTLLKEEAGTFIVQNATEMNQLIQIIFRQYALVENHILNTL